MRTVATIIGLTICILSLAAERGFAADLPLPSQDRSDYGPDRDCLVDVIGRPTARWVSWGPVTQGLQAGIAGVTLPANWGTWPVVRVCVRNVGPVGVTFNLDSMNGAEGSFVAVDGAGRILKAHGARFSGQTRDGPVGGPPFNYEYAVKPGGATYVDYSVAITPEAPGLYTLWFEGTVRLSRSSGNIELCSGPLTVKVGEPLKR
jgi:hypothetical protein